MKKNNIEWTKTGIDRRHFLKGASALALSTGAVGMLLVGRWRDRWFRFAWNTENRRTH